MDDPRGAGALGGIHAGRSGVEGVASAAAQQKLAGTVRDLERWGLLQYDAHAGGRWDLHPVVRGVAAGRLASEDRNRLGQRVVDHFSERPRDPYERAETLDDIRNGLQLVRALLQIGRTKEAAAAYRGDLARALMENLDAPAEVLSLLRPFFTADWSQPSAGMDERVSGTLLTMQHGHLVALTSSTSRSSFTELRCVAFSRRTTCAT